MNILIIIISLFLGFFPVPALAEEKFVTIDILSPDQNIIIGQTFPINAVVETNIINRTFYYLFYGGIGNTTSYIQTRGEDGPILSFTDDPYDWENLPTFTTDMSGNWHLQANNAFINPNTPPGNYSLYLKIFLPELYSDDINYSFASEPQQITVIPYSSVTITNTPVPTQTPIPTSSPTPISPTNTPTPTPIPTTHNQVPTLTPTPTPNIKIFGITTESSSSATPTIVESLSLTSEASNSTFIETGSNPPEIKPSPLPKKNIIIPLIILSFGVLFLAIPLVFLKIKKK